MSNIKKLDWYWRSGGGGSSYVPQPEYENLISYWDLQDTTFDLTDSGGNHLELVGAQLSGDGGVITTASNQYMTTPTSANLSFGNNTTDTPFSICFECKPTSFGTDKWILSKRDASTNDEYQIQLKQTTGQIKIVLLSQGGSSASLSVQTVAGVTISVKTFIVCTYDGSGSVSGLKIYFNGVLQSVTDTSLGSYVAMKAGTSNLVWCQQSWVLVGSSGFVGTMYKMQIHNVALSAETISAIYNSGSILEYTPNPSTQFLKVVDLNVIDVNGNYQFASDGTNLKWSSNNGASWRDYNWGAQWSSGTAIYNKAVDGGKIFNDGTVIFSCTNKLYRSTDGLQTINEITAKLSDGVTPFPIHSPANASFPGNYFANIQFGEYEEVDGNEMVIWGNYCNTPRNLGAAPLTFWYTIDKGATVKPMYRFGQNPNYKDNGTATGGATGTSLGDSGNSVIGRHAHSWYRIPNTNDWIFTTGDGPNENHWFRMRYDSSADTWSEISHLINGAAENTKYKNSGLCILDDDTVFFGSDATGGAANSELGVFETTIANIGVSETRIFTGGTDHLLRDFNINRDNEKICLFWASSAGSNIIKILLGDNYGASNRRYGFVTGAAGGEGFSMLSPVNNGYWKVVVGIYKNEPAKTLFIRAT